MGQNLRISDGSGEKRIGKIVTKFTRVSAWAGQRGGSHTGVGPTAQRPKSINNLGCQTTSCHGVSVKKPQNNCLKPPFPRLTPTEVVKWKAKGLCFKCDDKFVYPQVCRKKELSLLVVMEDGTEELLDCGMYEEETVEAT